MNATSDISVPEAPAKSRGGKPRKVKLPLDEQAVKDALERYAKGLRDGVEAKGTDGLPLRDPKTGEPILTAPNASWMNAASRFLENYGAVERLVRRERAAASINGMAGVAGRIRQLREAGRLGPIVPRAPDPAPVAPEPDDLSPADVEALRIRLRAQLDDAEREAQSLRGRIDQESTQ